MADTPILTQAQDALQRLVGSPTVNVSTGGRTATDTVSASSDLQGKSHQAYKQRLIDEEAAKKRAADLAAQTEAASASILRSTAAPAPAVAAAPAAAAAQRFLTKADLGGASYLDFLKGYQGAMSRYQGAMGKKDMNLANQYAGELGKWSDLMALQSGGADIQPRLGQLDYNTYAPFIKQYTALPRA